MLVSKVGSPVGMCFAIAYTDHSITSLVLFQFQLSKYHWLQCANDQSWQPPTYLIYILTRNLSSHIKLYNHAGNTSDNHVTLTFWPYCLSMAIGCYGLYVYHVWCW